MLECLHRLGEGEGAADVTRSRRRTGRGVLSTFGFSTPDSFASGVPQASLIRMYGDQEDNPAFVTARQRRRMKLWQARFEKVRQSWRCM